MNHHILIFFWDLEFMVMRKIQVKRLQNPPEKLILVTSPLQTKLTFVKHAFDFMEFVVHLKYFWTLQTLSLFRHPVRFLPYSYGKHCTQNCTQKLASYVIWNLRMSKQDWFHQLSQMMSDLSSCLDSRYLMLIQGSADSLSWSISDEPSPIEIIW